MRLSEDIVNKLLINDSQNNNYIGLDEINKFGDNKSTIEMITDLSKYSTMLEEKITFINDELSSLVPFTRENLYLMCALSGAGKCFKKGTKVLMYDGSVKNVEDIVVGDLVMGPDGKPRQVQTIAKGRDQMYEIVPKKGKSYIVNSDHILALKNKNNEIVTTKVSDFYSIHRKYKYDLYGFRSDAVEFNKDSNMPDIYLCGAFFANDKKRIQIDKKNKKVIQKIKDGFAYRNIDCKLFEHQTDIDVFFKYEDTTIDIESVKRSSINNRIEFLSAILDVHATSNHGCAIVLCQDQKKSEDICFIAKSLGLAAYIKKIAMKYRAKGIDYSYNRISISGDIFGKLNLLADTSPFTERKKTTDVLKYTLTIKKLQEDDYYGFSVDQDHLFLLDTFDVVHNSSTAANISYPLYKQKKKILIISNEEPKQDIVCRISCLEHGLNFNDFKKGKMSVDDTMLMIQDFQKITKYVKIVDVNSHNGYTRKIERVMDLLEQVSEADFSCVMIDYLQLITTSDLPEYKSKSAYEILSEFSKFLGTYIKRSNCPVVVFAQLHSIGKRTKDIDSRIKLIPSVIEPSTVVIEIVPDFEKQTSEFSIIKDRFGKQGQKVVCAFEKGRFVKLTQDHIDRVNKEALEVAKQKASEPKDILLKTEDDKLDEINPIAIQKISKNNFFSGK